METADKADQLRADPLDESSSHDGTLVVAALACRLVSRATEPVSSKKKKFRHRTPLRLTASIGSSPTGVLVPPPLTATSKQPCNCLSETRQLESYRRYRPLARKSRYLTRILKGAFRGIPEPATVYSNSSSELSSGPRLASLDGQQITS
jgi:hypothetical protein